MTILLVNTPFWKLFSAPAITLPTLAGYAAAKGIRCVQSDLSIELINHFLEPRRLRRVVKALLPRWTPKTGQ